MTRKQKIFKTMWRKHGEDILAMVYQQQPVTFAQICEVYKDISQSQVRHIINDMATSGLIKSVQHKIENSRGKAYIIDNERLVIILLELD